MEIEAQDYVDAITAQRNDALSAVAQLQAALAKLTRDLDAAKKKIEELGAGAS